MKRPEDIGVGLKYYCLQEVGLSSAQNSAPELEVCSNHCCLEEAVLLAGHVFWPQTLSFKICCLSHFASALSVLAVLVQFVPETFLLNPFHQR